MGRQFVVEAQTRRRTAANHLQLKESHQHTEGSSRMKAQGKKAANNKTQKKKKEKDEFKVFFFLACLRFCRFGRFGRFCRCATRVGSRSKRIASRFGASVRGGALQRRRRVWKVRGARATKGQ
ncbi:hypothetical protein CAOG_010054 [Capsaspora owczarzaki ATCC 30864]|uniref:Uncharacterized protein n=1 Tax=Capsaspora owczarzaki (strain ATCC 30864) TaxID=595528 RepID=A0A0D2WVD6_CAPO3|nr:hypothetical protein CAOG_010054 [Capsaspora owczarzaki ATCC 30864]